MKSILIVDDKIDIQEILADFLRNHGYKTNAYGNAKEAVEHMKEVNYDLIISDLVMPEHTGFDFIKTVREQKSSPPIIVITGGSPSTDFQKAVDELIEQGCQLLRKPFKKDELLKAVETALPEKSNVN